MGRPLLVAFGLLGVALFCDNGGLGPASLPLVLAACVLVGRALWARGEVPAQPRWPQLGLADVAAGVLVVEAVLVWVKAPGVYLDDAALPARALLTLAALGGAWAARTERAVPGRALLGALLVLVAVAGVLVLRGSPAPTIDVFTIQQEGARDLFRGLDPYRSDFTNPYTPEQTIAFFGEARDHLTNYPYPPFSLVVTAAGWRLAGDVRAALLVAQLLTAAGVFALARRHGARPGLAVALAAAFLAHPRGLFVLEQAWTEPLICAGFVAVLLLVDAPARGARWLALVAALAVMFSAKQYSPLLLPLVLAPRYSAAGRGAVLAGLAVAVAIALPFVLWDPAAFVDDVVMFQIHQPFRWNSLSLAPVIAFVTTWKPGLLGPLAGVATLVWGMRRGPRGTFGLALVAAATLLAFFVIAKQAFCNYYYFAGLAVLCAAITAPAPAAAAGPAPTPAA